MIELRGKSIEWRLKELERVGVFKGVDEVIK